MIGRYAAYGREVGDFVEVAQATPAGGKALGVVLDRSSRVLSVDSPLVGLPSYYPVLRPGAGSMVPLVYCGIRHIPCRPRSGAPTVLGGWDAHLVDPQAALASYDFVFVRGTGARRDPFADAAARTVARSGSWVVYERDEVSSRRR